MKRTTSEVNRNLSNPCRLGLDIGTNSIGWCLFTLSENKINSIVASGARIFHSGRDPKTGSSLAVERRDARGARNRRDRFKRRQSALLREMKNSGLLPIDRLESKSLELMDPFKLRTKGIDEELPLFHFGRALFHLNQRRGFRSNRISDRGDNESGKIKSGIDRLDQAMLTDGARSLGEFFYKRMKNAADSKSIQSIRARLSTINIDDSEKPEEGYNFYPSRKHIEEEFNLLWNSQARFHPNVLTEKLKEKLKTIIFFQRPLKPQKIGRCLFTEEDRIPKSHPLFQRRVLFETVNSLRIRRIGEPSRPLTIDERNKIIFALDFKKPTKALSAMKITLEALGKVIKLSSDEEFTLESSVRDSIACDSVLACMSHPTRFDNKWVSLNSAEQHDVIKKILEIETEYEFKELASSLVEKYGLTKEQAEKSVDAQNILPQGYGSIGLTATSKILNELESDVITFSQAVANCGWHHSDFRTGEYFDQLPYYGEVLDSAVIPGSGDKEDDEITRFGRITNPTVHIGLNQLRRLVNQIIKVYGKPDQVVVELARELKMSKRQKDDFNRKIRENTEAAKIRAKKLEELGLPNTGENRFRLRMYEELGPAIGPKVCPYTGKSINVEMLFSDKIEVDHILPLSRTNDDSPANKILCIREANREKKNQSPFEAWGNTPQWHTIEGNLGNLHKNKQWRFAPDAMKKFESESDFLDRAIVDTQYLSRLAKGYLSTLYTEGENVWTVNGKMTEMLRRRWGLNNLLSDSEHANDSKNREDHRHHAIDAAVIAATDRSLVQKISSLAKKAEIEGVEKHLKKIPPPWENFRSDLKKSIQNLIVSHRTDHGKIVTGKKDPRKNSTSGKLFNETALGIIDDDIVVSRIPLLSLTPSDIFEIEKGKIIRDPNLQKTLAKVTEGKTGGDFVQSLINFSQGHGQYFGIRHVRMIEKLRKTARVEIRDPKGKQYKAYKSDSNHCIEIWKLPDGNIQSRVVSTYEANTNADVKPHPAAKKLFRLFKRDTVILEENNQKTVYYIQKFNQAKQIYLAEHFQANADARNRDSENVFKFKNINVDKAVKEFKMHRIIVNEIGQLVDNATKST